MATPHAQRIRMATAEDVPQLVGLATGIHELMTTMPRTSEQMLRRVEASQASLNVDVESVGVGTQNETYFFVLEEDGEIIGTSAIYAAVGLDRPFYNYKIGTRSQVSPELDVRVDYRVLQPVNDYTGSAEVGTLYLDSNHRGGGRGRLLSLCRFMFLAAHRERFGRRVMAELRGWTNADGSSPFWDAVGAKFYGLDLQTADLRSGYDFRFIADLLPPFPIFIDLLPEEAQEVIGRANRGSEPAAAMLRKQGFRNNDYVDIFDAGLCLDAHIEDLDAVRRSARLPFELDTEAGKQGIDAIVSTTGLDDFRVAQAKVLFVGGRVLSGPELAQNLDIGPGDPLLVYPLEAVK